MAREPYCAVCGVTVDPGDDHTEVNVEHIHAEDMNDRQRYYLHETCAFHVLGNWEEP